MRIDLHTHSSASDGTQEPGLLVEAAAAAGVDVLALTDHDTTAGWTEAADTALGVGVALVRGTEVSARSGGVSVHLLSYLHDPTHPALAEMLERTRAARLSRARTMVELLRADVGLTWDEVLATTAPGATVGRPHIADALVARGVVPDRNTAFSDLLTATSKYYVPHYAPEVLDAVLAIRASGGVPVFAHPGADGRGRVVPDAVIDAMVASGLAGLEVHHRDHSPAQRERLLAIAARHGLLVTGSSDFHGTGKDNRLGEFTTAPDVLAAIEEQGTLAVVRP